MWGTEGSWSRWALGDGNLVELLRLAFWDAETFPSRALEVLGEEDDLADVVGVVKTLAVDGLEHGMGFVANDDDTTDVGGCERIDGPENNLPAGVAPGDDFGTRCVGVHFEFGVAMAV